jgi:hypothetical protein
VLSLITPLPYNTVDIIQKAVLRNTSVRVSRTHKRKSGLHYYGPKRWNQIPKNRSITFIMRLMMKWLKWMGLLTLFECISWDKIIKKTNMEFLLLISLLCSSFSFKLSFFKSQMLFGIAVKWLKWLYLLRELWGYASKSFLLYSLILWTLNVLCTQWIAFRSEPNK